MDEALKILVADDDAVVWANSIKMFLRDLPSVEISLAESPQECLERIEKEKFAIVLLDISFSTSDNSGLSLVPAIQAKQPSAKIFMLSSHDDDHTMVRCLQLGAADFISKRTIEPSGIADIIRGFISGEATSTNDIERGKELAAQNKIILSSQAMIDVFAKVALARRSPATPVLITGETGVGKDVVASAVAARTLSKPYVTVDCGAIPETLAESEFFGHTKGAFTGADSNKQGKFQLANNGDLFLDEIGNLKRGIQDKFLRAIQNKEITPLGSTRSITVTTRIIAATNENLEDLVTKGVFRKDLLERLKGIWIHIPPLRERPEDIQAIAEAMIAKSDKPDVTIAPPCLSLLKSYSWPGNVRELEHLIREMLSKVETGPLTLRHLPDHFRLRLASDLNLDAANARQHTPGIPINLPGEGTLEQAEQVFLAKYLASRYARLGANPSKAQLARDLQISRTTLDGYLKRSNVELGEVMQ